MRPLKCTLPIVLCFIAVSAFAQTYTPKKIVVQGADGMDAQQIIDMTGLKPGPMTKDQIETALQRLGDTGSFDALSYTVSSQALTLVLTPSAAAQMAAVRFTNFVWWTPSELTALIQARVPLYQGKLSLKGAMLEQVEAALVDILKQKGIDGEVTHIAGYGAKSMALAISRPPILLGDIQVRNSLPTVASKLADMKAGFAAQEFDRDVTAVAIPLNTSDLYHDAGYLDATADPVTFAPPRKEKNTYLIDATTEVHPGELYRIAHLTFVGSPLSPAEMEKAAALKPGDPAGTFTIQHASDSLAHAYSQRGFLEAKSKPLYPTNTTTHTVDVTFTVTPGELYHLAAIDTSKMPASAQAAIAKDGKLRAGVVVDQEAIGALQQHLAPRQFYTIVPDREHHLATIAVAAQK